MRAVTLNGLLQCREVSCLPAPPPPPPCLTPRALLSAGHTGAAQMAKSVDSPRLPPCVPTAVVAGWGQGSSLGAHCADFGLKSFFCARVAELRAVLVSASK